MKKSEIYKYALAATIKELARGTSGEAVSHDEIYAIVGTICEKIDVELLTEHRENNGEVDF